jgi:hypothetical protein
MSPADVVGVEVGDPSRSRRVQALLCTAPLHELQSSRSMRGSIFRALDCYDLALAAIDDMVDQMGFDSGYSRRIRQLRVDPTDVVGSAQPEDSPDPEEASPWHR